MQAFPSFTQMTRWVNGKLLEDMKTQKSEIVLVTYADKAYIQSAKALERRAKAIGFSDIRVFGPSNLTSEFTAKNKETLALSRGAGYWIWKPSIIDAVLKSMKDNQLLLYCDAGVMLRSGTKYFEEIAEDDLIHLWSPRSNRGTNNSWIDKDVWVEITGVTQVSSTSHYWAGLILGKNNETFRELIAIWLDLCQREHLLRPDSKEGYIPSAGLIAHRHDQSILNCLIHLEPSWFNLHSLNSNLVSSPVLIHRRGKVKSYAQAFLIVLVGWTYRKFTTVLPKKLRYFIFSMVTRRRRPYVSKTEIERHLKFFLD